MISKEISISLKGGGAAGTSPMERGNLRSQIMCILSSNWATVHIFSREKLCSFRIVRVVVREICVIVHNYFLLLVQEEWREESMLV